MNYLNEIKFHRDSRHAFGHRFAVEKPSSDWQWAIAGAILAIVIVMALASKVL